MSTARPSIAARIGWLGLGTLLTVGVFEVGFRVLERALDRSAPGEEAEFTILAEGDSFTYGIGGLSFPQQLEEQLNRRAGRRRYRAINEGVPGLNSAMVADRLEAHFQEHQPDVAIILIGENNSWNAIRVDGVDEAGVFDQVDEALLAHSRVYKFVRVATIGWGFNTFHEAAERAEADRARRDPTHVGDEAEQSGLAFPTGEPHLDKIIIPDLPPEGLEEVRALIDLNSSGQYEACVAAAEAFHTRWPDEPQGYVTKAAALRRLNRLDEAEVALLKARELGEGEILEEITFSLGSTRHRAGNMSGAVAAWTEGLRLFPESEAIYWSLARAWHDEGKTFEALEVAEVVPEVVRNPMHQYLVRMAAELEGADVDAEISAEFRQDVRRMIALGRTYGVKLIFSSYPDVVYEDVAAVAGEEGVVHVDFRPWFASRFSSREEYISSDRCHCNTLGYALMAEVYADHVEHLLGFSPAVRTPPPLRSSPAIDHED